MKQITLISLLLILGFSGVLLLRPRPINTQPATPESFPETGLKKYTLKLLPSASIPARTILASLEKIKMVPRMPLDIFFQIVGYVLADENISLIDRLGITFELLSDMNEDQRGRFITELQPIHDLRLSLVKFLEQLIKEQKDKEKLAKINGIQKVILEKLEDVALLDSVNRKNIEVAKQLLERNPNLANTSDIFKNTPLMFAAKNLDFPMVQLLVEKGANINAQDEAGTTALMYVDQAAGPDIFFTETLEALGKKDGATEGYKIHTYLIEHGADESIQDNEGRIAGDYLSLRVAKDIRETIPALGMIGRGIQLLEGMRQTSIDYVQNLLEGLRSRFPVSYGL